MAENESLTEQFQALHRERVRSWKPENLAENVARRARLVADFDPSRTVRPGDVVESFQLAEADGTTLTLERLTAEGPAVLIFFRYAGCPACNLALPYYERQLWPRLRKAGIPLVAISPHLPETGLGAIRERHGLTYGVANDRGNALARRFGITFDRDLVPDGQPSPGWIGELTGTGTAELPQPAVIAIDRDRVVRFVDVSPDWLARTEAPAILEAVGRIESAAVG
ncbi:alkyl hydroperoxide reductase [Sphingobium indicum IP26]|uniref:Alkyl hydroperoxide reductase n=1 Tax=Sphingobium indicum F2 TaxID=1450518 RepID=A0A8E0WR33_9SPHN|nr:MULTISPECIES: peroxiredoxin-like family protein [Sphingobium]EPR14953.1 alkyl hydroperoxide reductase [Sphingobium indicum IP26]EQB02648.1 alkyl hydroperoxide reductase [Sphingobium sp. HDIP04]KER35875.1 alkyl hydroperoxide reductase [Sphingobium indicum F2]